MSQKSALDDLLDISTARLQPWNMSKQLVDQRQRRAFRVRKRIRGTAERPRLTRVPQPQAHLRAGDRRRSRQDAGRGQHRSTRSCRGKLKYGGNKDAAQAVGKAIAERAMAAGIKQVCFDRGAYQYHGRVAALADAAREGGLSF